MLCSLTFENRDQLSQILNAARINGSLASLKECIINLTASERVVLRPHPSCLEFAIFWFDGDAERPYMVGGLIYHHSDNSWSIHT